MAWCDRSLKGQLPTHVLVCDFQEQIYTGTDITLLLKAIHAAQDVINKIKDMRKGMMGSALISIMNEVRNNFQQIVGRRGLCGECGCGIYFF